MSLRTVQDVKSRILKVFPRSSDEIPGMVDSDFPCWIKALCRMHPWWFNEIRPGAVAGKFPLDYGTILPSPFPGSGQWFHRGWMVLDPNMEVYEFKAPYNDVHPEYGFHDAQTLRVAYLKLYSDEGRFQTTVPVRQADYAHSLLNHGSEGTGDYPAVAWVDDFPDISVLRIHPLVGRKRVIALQFHLADCPIYTIPGDPSGDEYNRMVTAVPELLLYYGLMRLAEFFGEDAMYVHYREVLYGNPPLGISVAGTTHGGFLNNLRREGEEQSVAKDTRLEYYTGASAPFGTSLGGGRGRRGRRSGTYWTGS